jgi:hypothetical protein
VTLDSARKFRRNPMRQFPESSGPRDRSARALQSGERKDYQAKQHTTNHRCLPCLSPDPHTSPSRCSPTTRFGGTRAADKGKPAPITGSSRPIP